MVYKKHDASKDRDVVKFSLWYVDRDYKSRTTVATGKATVILDDGTEITLNIYLHENKSKKSNKSPDFFGFVKENHDTLEPLTIDTRNRKVVEINQEEYIQEYTDEGDAIPF